MGIPDLAQRDGVTMSDENRITVGDKIYIRPSDLARTSGPAKSATRPRLLDGVGLLEGLVWLGLGMCATLGICCALAVALLVK